MHMSRDIVLLGASTGGVEALQHIVGALPSDLPAALLVVMHVSPDSPALLATILDHAGPLAARTADDGVEIQRGHIYCARPDHHLLVREGKMFLVRGPRENRARPAVDPLFRTAAVAYGPRVLAGVLTGWLDDGSAGLLDVKLCGGGTFVQDPATAMAPDMPRNAMETVDPDEVVPPRGDRSHDRTPHPRGSA